MRINKAKTLQATAEVKLQRNGSIERERDRVRGETMALYLRRAIRLRNTTLLLRSSNFQTCNISHFLFSHNQETCHTQKPTPSPSLVFLRDSRRGFAKGKKSSTFLTLSFSFYAGILFKKDVVFVIS